MLRLAYVLLMGLLAITAGSQGLAMASASQQPTISGRDERQWDHIRVHLDHDDLLSGAELARRAAEHRHALVPTLENRKRLTHPRRPRPMALASIGLFATMFMGLSFLAWQTFRLRRHQTTIIESRERLSAIVRSAHDAVVVADGSGLIIEWNEAAVRVFGYSKDEAVGQSAVDLLFPPHLRAAQQAGLKRMLADASALVQRIELEARHKLGDIFPIELALGVTKSASEQIVVAFMRDITERKLATASLKLARDRAEAASRAKAEFLAVMSHEMRTPLNGIIGVMDLLARTHLTPQQAEYVDTAIHAGDALLAQINDVLDLSKLDAGKLVLESRPFRLDKIIDGVFAIMAPEAESRNTLLSSRIEADVPLRLKGDATRLRQVLLNLVSNAVKFTEGGTITVSFELCEGGDGERLQLRGNVTDTGIGIPPSRIGELFKDFSMLDQSSTRRVGGTGLGLAISRRLIHLMGGQIGATSAPGQGSTFSFSICLERDLSEEVADCTAPSESAVTPLRVLVAEDNPVNQMVVRHMLEQAGHSVTIVGNGREAVDDAAKGCFDVILMDASMPEMDGCEATRRIRALPGAVAGVPIIAVTAHALAGDKERFLAAGMNGYLTKPIRRATLEARLTHVQPRHDGSDGNHNLAETSKGDLLLSSATLESLAEETSEELLPIIVDQFLSEMQRRLAELHAAKADGDLMALGKAAHALSGAAATLGARRLCAVSREIESRARAGQGPEALQAMDVMEKVVSDTDQAFRSGMRMGCHTWFPLSSGQTRGAGPHRDPVPSSVSALE